MICLNRRPDSTKFESFDFPDYREHDKLRLRMRLNAGLHLAYCTNVHRSETWAETFESLKNCAIPVRNRVCPNQPYAIGLCLSNQAAQELADSARLLEFQRWLGSNHCYVSTINGFLFGHYHGTRVKEQAYEPDWYSPERIDYTNLLFDLLTRLIPPDLEGNVTTLPCSFKGFYLHADELKAIRNNLWHCVEHVARRSEQTGRKLHLALEPEPLCLLESSGEVLQFFDRLRAEHPRDPRLNEHLCVDYDTCHFAVEFEEPQNAILCLLYHEIKIGKIHLGSALKLHPTAEARKAVAPLVANPFLHQVVARRPDGQRFIYPNLRAALADEPQEPPDALVGQPAATGGAELPEAEWRVRFHLPLHTPLEPPFDNTTDHTLEILDLLAANPQICSHLEIESTPWTPGTLQVPNADLIAHLESEYRWTLDRLKERGIPPG